MAGGDAASSAPPPPRRSKRVGFRLSTPAQAAAPDTGDGLTGDEDAAGWAAGGGGGAHGGAGGGSGGGGDGGTPLLSRSSSAAGGGAAPAMEELPHFVMLADADAAALADAPDSSIGGGGGATDSFDLTLLRGASTAAAQLLSRGREIRRRSRQRTAAPATRLAGALPLNMPFLSTFGGGARAPVDGGVGGAGGAGSGSRCGGGDGLARVVTFNDADANKARGYANNYVSTTKYSLWNVVPKFLWEQFTRFSNAYFLIVGILYTIDSITPVFTAGRYGALWSLALVVVISGIKEALEDWRRYREDRRVNRATTHVVRLGGEVEECRWDSVHVGDILRVNNGEQFPADLLLLASSSPDGLAYVETKQLDGESNLKLKLAPPELSSRFSRVASCGAVSGSVECEPPNDRLYRFNGRCLLAPGGGEGEEQSREPSSDGRDICAAATAPLVGTAAGGAAGAASAPTSSASESQLPLGPEHLFIRGSSLRNTEWVLGLVLATGRDTKLMQNMKTRPRKSSRLEKETNKHYWLSLLLQLVIVVVLTSLSARNCSRLSEVWYLFEPLGCSPGESFLRFFTFFVTFSGLIPISLYVSMEIVRGFQVYFIEGDALMMDPATDVRAEVRTSNLNEELGVVSYVLSDKTGTLTANKMESKLISLNGRVYSGLQRESVERALAGDGGGGGGDGSSLSMDTGGSQTPSTSVGAAAESLSDLVMALKLAEKRRQRPWQHYEPRQSYSRHRHGEDGDESLSDSDGRHSGADGADAGSRRSRRSRRRERPISSSSSSSSSSSLSSSEESPLSGGGEDSDRFTRGDLAAAGDALRLLAICHTVVAEGGPDGELLYQASSPDEAALVQAARSHGFTFLRRSNTSVLINVFGREEEYHILAVLEFDSARKRMSVIARGPDGQVRVYMKGADSVVFARLGAGEPVDATSHHLHDFAVAGLRTLCLASAVVGERRFRKWHTRYRAAGASGEGRDDRLAEVAAEIEVGLSLLGATAIEDKLQDGVPETLQVLERAGVKVWMLTGDKLETAINIGLSCGMLDDGMDVVVISEDSVDGANAQLERAIGRWSALRLEDTPGAPPRTLGLVIDGQTLHFALAAELHRKFMLLGTMARSVIACRVSPKQKTELVELVRRLAKDKVTLAIGDGANDVGMIQAAHVGVGIVGVEGKEAKLASDFAIGQFRFLARLMVVHGRWSYKRLSKMVLYTIYKNSLLTLCELYWATFSAYSGQPLFDPWMSGMYNLLVASIPPLVLGTLDQELGARYAIMFPEVYRKGQRNSAYSGRVFVSWLFAAIWQSALLYFLAVWGAGDRPVRNGQLLGMWSLGALVFTLVLAAIHLTAVVYMSSWTVLSATAMTISFISWYVLGPLFSLRAISLDSNLAPNMYAVVHRVFEASRTWLLLILAPLCCVLPVVSFRAFKRHTRPNLKAIVQELARVGMGREAILDRLRGIKPFPDGPGDSEALADLTSAGGPHASAPTTPAGDGGGGVGTPASPGGLPSPLVFTTLGEPADGLPSPPQSPGVTFVKREAQYLYSGFNFDVDESAIVLRLEADRRGGRQPLHRQLKRTWSDTELHGGSSGRRGGGRGGRSGGGNGGSGSGSGNVLGRRSSAARSAHKRCLSAGDALTDAQLAQLDDDDDDAVPSADARPDRVRVLGGGNTGGRGSGSSHPWALPASIQAPPGGAIPPSRSASGSQTTDVEGGGPREALPEANAADRRRAARRRRQRELHDTQHWSDDEGADVM